MLEIGTSAPAAPLTDAEGRSVRLTDFRGRSAVLVYFLRTTTCPVCNRHVRDLAERAEALTAAGVEVLVAVPEDREAAAKWRAKRGIPFRVLAGDAAYSAAGLGRGMLGTMQQSGTLLIDVDGVVRYARGAAMPTGGYDGKDVADAVARWSAAARA
jgi:peroxiredoxin